MLFLVSNFSNQFDFYFFIVSCSLLESEQKEKKNQTGLKNFKPKVNLKYNKYTFNESPCTTVVMPRRQ